jgi:hypothetical protein
MSSCQSSGEKCVSFLDFSVFTSVVVKKVWGFWGINFNMQAIRRIERARSITVWDSNLPPKKLEKLMGNSRGDESRTIPSLKFFSYFHHWYCRSALFSYNRVIWYGRELVPDYLDYCLPSLQCITTEILRNRASTCQSARNCASNTSHADCHRFAPAQRRHVQSRT